MTKLCCMLCILFSFFSCRSTHRLSDQKIESDTVSVSQFIVRDSIKDLFFKSGFDSRKWDIVWEHVLYGSDDTTSCLPVKEKRTVTLRSQSMAKQKVMSESKSIKDVLYDRLDSVHVEVDRKESVEKEPFSISLNLFWILLVLLVMGICIRVLKS